MTSQIKSRWSGTPRRLSTVIPYGAVLAGVGVMTALIHALPGADRIPNISILYLLVVIGAGRIYGSRPAIWASVLSFLAFDWYFVSPRYTFTVSDPAEWLALIMFLITAATTGHLTAAARAQADEARRRELETAALAEASWAVARQVGRDPALSEVLLRIRDVTPIRGARIYAADPAGPALLLAWHAAAHGAPEAATPSPQPPQRAPDVIQFVLHAGRPVGWGDDRRHWDKALGCDPSDGSIYLPLTSEDRVLGVLQLEPDPDHVPSAAERRVIESLANHAAVVLDRDRLNRAEARTHALLETDRLKTALLGMVSHDFRSPLASIKASATACLQGDKGSAPPWQGELQRGIIQEVDRLNKMVGNILSLSRLEADAWKPQREPAALVEVIESARTGFSREANARIDVSLPSGLEELWVDPIQIGQVLHNLLDNALKYSPSPSRVELCVTPGADNVTFEVMDRGPGLPPGEEARVFERFYRGPRMGESAVPGMGIGLAVCRGLSECHQGRLTAENRVGGGAVFRLTLPLE